MHSSEKSIIRLLAILLLLTLACRGLQPLEQETPVVEQYSYGGLRSGIVYTGADGNLYLLESGTGQQRALTTDAAILPGEGDAFVAYRFPTWAPDGRHIAFVRFAHDAVTTSSALMVIRPDGSAARTLFESEETPFYLYWSPDSRQVAFLAPQPGTNELALHLAQVGEESSQRLDAGQPYYWQWSPDGRQLITHVGGQGGHLALLDVAGEGQEQRLSLQPLAFQAPAWSPDGERILLAAEGEETEAGLLLIDAEGQVERVLGPVEGAVAFGWSPSGDRIAFLSSGALAQAAIGPLHLLDPANPEDERVIDHDLIIAFFWSPDGRKLAYFVLTDAPTERQVTNLVAPARAEHVVSVAAKSEMAKLISQPQEQRVYLELRLFDRATETIGTLLTFEPTDAFLNLLPFFDQYQHSSRLWSPDSAQLIVGALTADRPTLWLVPTDPTLAPERLAEGVVGFWSWE